MKFLIPTNLKNELIELIPNGIDAEMYGSLSSSCIGSGRSEAIIPKVSKKYFKKHIEKINKKNMKFNYLLNATCFWQDDFFEVNCGKIEKYLNWIKMIGVNSISVSSLELLRLIKKKYNYFKVGVSVQLNINTVEEVKRWEALGVDRIVLSVLDINRNFKLLRKIRSFAKCELFLIANLTCLLGCNAYTHHAKINSHASQSGHPLKGYFIDACSVACNIKRFNNEVEYIKSQWIRPEDLCYYDDLGIDGIKFVGRQMQTKYIVKIVKAYLNRAYHGNLMDLLSTPDKSIVNRVNFSKSFFRKIYYFFRPFCVNPFKLKRAALYVNKHDIYIDNKLLDGFLDFFLKGKCNYMCELDCNYCSEIAEKVITVINDKASMKNNSSKFLEMLYSQDMFSV